MTVDQLLAKLAAACPAFNAKATEAWAPVFRARLGKHEGQTLAHAYIEVMGTFTVKASKSLFPTPADFETHLPSSKLNLPKDTGPTLDFDARKRRADVLFSIWRAGQAIRAGKDNPAIVRALEVVARPIADVAGWSDNPEPLILTRDQIRVAYQRAISMERRNRYGRMPYNRFAWWEQIKAVAGEWGIELTPEQWDAETARHLAIPQDIAA